MKHLVLIAALLLGTVAVSQAGELDNESSVTNQQAINGTIVIRVDQNGSASVLASATPVAAGVKAHNLVEQGQFQALTQDHVRSELDSDGGAASWYFYNGYNYNYGYMNWYGNWFTPYYTYNYGYYRYYYYSSYYW